MKWVLILTLFGDPGYYGQRNPTIASVPSFSSRAACLAAGNAWLKQLPRFTEYGPYAPRALCVRLGDSHAD